METEDLDELPVEVCEILVSFRSSRRSGDRDLWRRIASQLRDRSLGPRAIRRALCEVVSIDMRESWRSSDVDTDAATFVPGSASVTASPLLEDYLAELPELQTENGIPVELLLLEHEVRTQSGLAVDTNELQQRFPREWPAVQAHLVQTIATSDGTTSVLKNTTFADEISGSTLSFPSMTAPLPGQRPVAFGDYELLHEIARGGMGVVYKARQTKLNRVVAVKMILAGQLASDEHVRRFYSEAEAAAKLDHPGIVPIYEVGKVGDQHFFSMGYVNGAGLADRVSKGPLVPRVAATLVKAVAEATAYAHQMGVIHRDLKPQNILLTADEQPKITDFGLAKSVEGDSNLTASGQILGTPSYMPPEQAAGRISEIGPASDVYSLGAVLYCLLTGRPPFQSPNVMETLKLVMTKEPVSPRLLSPTVDRDLETICLKCLEKDPARRMKSAQELADELGRYLKGEPIRSRRIGPLMRVARWCRRNPLAMALSTAVIVLVGLSFVSWMLVQEAARSRKIASIKERFQQVIDSPELTETYLKLGESVLNEMTEHDPKTAQAGRERMHAVFVDHIESELRTLKIDSEHLTRLGTAISFVHPFDPDRAVELQKLLDQRAKNWVSLFDLKPAFAQLNAIFEPGHFKVDGSRRLIRAIAGRESATATSLPKATASAIRSKIEIAGDVRIEATFDGGWQSARQLGLACGLSQNEGYVFRLQRVESSSAVSTAGTVSTDPHVAASAPQPAGESDRPPKWILQLIRNESVLREQHIEPGELSGDALRMTATRQDDRISVQVNDLPVLVFDDAFALSRVRSGAFGIIVSSDVGVTRIAAAQLPRSAGTNPLDRGNELYSDGRFDEALAQFQEVGLSAGNPATLQEARYKQAVCLNQLGRPAEATPILMQLFTEPGDRWPMLSGTLVWVSLLREKKLDDAEGIYQRLETEYPFERLAAIVTDDMRREILAAYRPPKSSRVAKGMGLSAKLIRDVERMWIVQKLLQPSGPAFDEARNEVYWAYLLAGDIERATKLVDESMAIQKSEWGILERVRLLRHRGRSDEALRELEPHLFAPDGTLRPGFNTYMFLDRIRCHADLNQWDQVEKDLQEFRNVLSSFDLHSQSYMNQALRLYEGILLSKYGDRAAAVAAWRDGPRRDQATGRHIVEGTSEYHLVRALSGDLDAADASSFLTKFEGPQAGALGATLQSAITPESLVPALRDMWNSPRGQDWLDKFAFIQIFGSEEVRIRLSLFVLEYIRINAFRSQMTESQADVIWDLLGEAFQAFTVDGTLAMSKMLPLALTWKGNTSIFGWDSVASSIRPEMRAQFAYVLAHRFLHLGRPNDAMKFFKIIQKDGVPGSSLMKLAKAEMELLESGHGTIRLRARIDHPIRVIIKTDGQPSLTMDVESEASRPLPPAKYELQIASPADRGLKFTNSQIEVLAGMTTTAEIESPWDANSHVIPLPGAIPKPSQFPNVRRWQLVLKESPNGWNHARMNPTHSVVAIGGKDGHVRLWDVATRETTKILLGHSSNVSSIGWHPREPRLAAGGDDGTVHIWNTETGHHQVALRGTPTAVTDVAWSPDGRHLVTTWSAGEGAARLWSETGVAGPVLPVSGILYGVTWRPDSKMFATVGADRHLRLWNLEGRLEHDFASPDSGEMRTVAWSPDGQTVATGGYDRLVRFWNASERVAGPTFAPSNNGAFTNSVAFSPDGTRLAAGTQDGYVAIYDQRTRTRSYLSDPAVWVASVQWTADSKQLFTTNADASFRFWSDEAKLLAHVQTPVSHFGIHEYSPDQHRFVVNNPGTPIELRDSNSSKILTFPQSQSEPATVAWSPDGRWVAVSFHHSRSISIWNTNTGLIQAQANIDEAPATILAWDWESSRLAFASTGNTVYTLDLQGKQTAVIPNLPQKVLSMAWRPQSNVLSIIYERSNAKPVIQLWDLTTKNVSNVATDNFDYADRLQWSPTGKHLATIHGVRAVIWDAEGRTATPCVGHTGGISRICWSPDGQTLATASWDQTGRLWNLNGQWTTTLNGHRAPVERIQWSAEGKILTCGQDQSTRIWNSADGRLLETTLWLPEANAVTFGNSGEVLRRTPSSDKHVRFVVERPLGTQTYAATETLSWQQFEKVIGLPLERPQGLASSANNPAAEEEPETHAADATRPSNLESP